jgi:sRNA-binding carbon storage regulator CsrA
MGRCIPIEGLPFCGSEIAVRCGDKYGDVLRIEGMAVRAAVDAPEMIVVNLRNDAG